MPTENGGSPLEYDTFCLVFYAVAKEAFLLLNDATAVQGKARLRSGHGLDP